MILRRVIEHVKTQNWLAVGLDFLIVVTGVFIGIQVANWNAERQLAAQERAYLAQLREEILVNYGAVDLRMRYNDEVVAGGGAAIAMRHRSRLVSGLIEFSGREFRHETRIVPLRRALAPKRVPHPPSDQCGHGISSSPTKAVFPRWNYRRQRPYPHARQPGG